MNRETRQGHGSAGRWRRIVALSAVGALLVVLAGPARSAAGTSVTAVTANNSSPSAAAAAQTVYVVMFTTSRNGPLSGAAGSTITLVFPAGTGLGSVFTSSVDDTTTGANGIGACNPPSGETITCFLNSGNSVAAGNSVRVTINGVTNPSTPSSLTMSVSTSSDTTPVSSAPYTVVPANQISQPAVSNSSPSATAGAQTAYVVTFTASKTGGLSNAAGSGIALVFPAGTGLGSVSSSSVDDTTTGVNGVGFCNAPSGEAITCVLNLGSSIAAGDSVRVTINGVINPSTPSSSLTLSVSTSSDTTPVSSAPYSVSLPPPVAGKSVDVAPVSGVVLVKRPGQKVFTRLHAGERIPLFSTVNTRHGVVSITGATDSHGHTATGRAYGGLFIVKQRLVGGTEMTVLALAGPKPAGCSATAARAAGRRPPRHRAVVVRDPGNFVTVGIYASGTDWSASPVKWLTEDTCAGTVIRVELGSVLVDDFPKHRRFVLAAGHSFLARPGKGG